MRPKVIQRRKLSDDVAAEIEAMIHSGEFVAGGLLPSSREFMELFGVGRPAVREALFSLQKVGLITITNGTCARVTTPTASNVVNLISGAARHLLAQPGGLMSLQNARLLFECALARRAAEQATQVDIANLKVALDANQRSINDLAVFETTDVAFHCALAEIVGNPIFIAIHEAMAGWLREQRHVSLRVPGASKIAYQSHKLIFEAVAAADVDAAEKAMCDHMNEVAARYHSVKEPRSSQIGEPIQRNRGRSA